MTTYEQIKKAEQLCKQLQGASTQISTRGGTRRISGADPNELKKLLAFLLKHRDRDKLKNLLKGLKSSPFTGRSASTRAYYQNIQTVLDSGFYQLAVDDGIQVLGWMCRIL